MSKCSICETRIQKGWEFCPGCGVALNNDGKTDEYPLERIRYLWERQERGKFIYSNFKAVKNVGNFAYGNTRPTRPKLGDFYHIHLSNLQKFSFLYLSPTFITQFYKIGKLKGYYSAGEALRTLKLEKFVSALSRTGLQWNVLKSEKIQKAQIKGWYNTKAVMMEDISVNEKDKTLEYSVEESYESLMQSPKPCCFINLGTLCGQAEALSGGFWDGVETKCKSKGDECCRLELYFHEKEEEPKIDMLKKKDLDSILDEVISNVVQKKENLRDELGDFTYISEHQCINYFMVSLSKGHEVLSKYSGKSVGERIMKKAEVENLEGALSYLEELFLYLKAGILKAENKPGRILIRMDESVYASGVSNINMKLDTFLAGIIEGSLNQATGEKWTVIETKCLADGDAHCEFRCRRNK